MKRIITVLLLMSSFLFGQTIIISEVMQNPSAVTDGNGEWFELYNATASDIDINGWTIKDDDSDNHIINNGSPLNVPAGGFLVLGNNSDMLTNGGVLVSYSYPSSFYLGNSSDELVLVDLSNTEVDRIMWDNGATFPDPNGSSMYFIGNPGDNNNLGSNWTTSTTPWTGSSGDNGSPGEKGDGALPVELTTFSALVSNKSVDLNWETATEVNNYGFEVQRQYQISSTENQEWENIAFVQGHGNSNSPKYYSYSDISVEASGKYLYRLKQVDIDGTFEYSAEVEANLGAPNTYELNQNFPNPFNPMTSIHFNIPQDSQVKLNVFNVLGEEVAELINDNMAAGYHSVNFDASHLNSGIYFYKLESNNFTQIRKMMLVK